MKRKNNKGVTIIALVVTIIILLILAGVILSLTIGKSGIINNAEVAEKEANKQTATEKINLKITNSQMNNYAQKQRMPILQELADDFCEDNEIEYVTLKSKKLAGLDKIEVGDNNSIFTKLKEYPYEFEINSSLQLASIDGVSVLAKSNPNLKVLFDNKISNGTITFNENTIDDYDYYEFFFGQESRVFSQIVSKEYLKYPMKSGDCLYVSGSASSEAMATVYITNITDNTITFNVLLSGNSWTGITGYLFKIIGRNV